MIIIGAKRQRPVRKRENDKLVPVFDQHDQPVMKLVASEVVRVTRQPLGGHFGLDKSRRLVVALRDGDILELRPEGTRQASRMAIADIYAYMLRCESNRRQLEKARSRKAAKGVQMENASIKRMEKRLRRA
jgi:hypothetical protein